MILTQKRKRAKSRRHPAGLRVGSFSARRACGYSDAQALPIYNSKKIASGKGGEKIKGVCKKMKLYTAAVVAKWLDISERRVRQLRDQKVLEEARPGLYSLKDCIHRYIEYLRKDGTEDAAVDYNQERAKLVRTKRERQELELQLERREALAASEVEEVMTDMLLRFRQRVRAIPVKLSPTLATETDQTEIFLALKRATDEALEELADFDSAFSTQEGQEGADDGTIRQDDI